MTTWNSGAYSTETLDYLNSRPREARVSLGQFITPRVLRQQLLDRIDLRPGMRVLDPGVGTGEFLADCLERERSLYLEGWDVDPQAAEVAQRLVPDARIEVQSALDVAWKETFDVVVGNPPYFEVKGLPPKGRDRFAGVISGRPNIFAFFFQVGLEMLVSGGRLAYVVPPSMNNGAYFDALRSFISGRAEIEFLRVMPGDRFFEDAQTAVQLMVLRKGGRGLKHIVDIGSVAAAPRNRIIFAENPDAIESEFEERSTIWNLGFEVTTGTVVWNTKKDLLRRSKNDGCVPLLWAHNIGADGELQFIDDHPKKPQWLESASSQTGPAIIVNRISGSVGSGSLRCAFVPEGVNFLAENHVNVIKARRGWNQAIGWPELMDLLRRPEVSRRVRLLTGNTQVSATELNFFLPLDTRAAAKPVTETLF